MLFFLLGFLGFVSSRKEIIDYDYLDHGKDWKSYDYCMTGTQQSPIDLLSFPQTLTYKNTNYLLTNYQSTKANLTFYNTTVVLEAYDAEVGFGALYTVAPDDTATSMYFTATTLRVRAPAEHTMKGVRSAMEIQIQHKVRSSSHISSN